MMPAASYQRTVGISVALGVLAVALSGCGNVMNVGADASAGHGGGGASGVAGATGAGGAGGAGGSMGGTSGAAGAGGATGTGGSGATGVAGTDGTGSGGRGGGAGVAGGGGAGRGGTTGGGGAGRGGTTGVGGSAAGRGGTTGGGGSGGAAGRGGTTGTGGVGQCAAILCPTGRMCCGNGCVNLQNDPLNCGKCDNVCPASAPFCGDGTCGRPPCEPNVICIGTATCCGNMCCGVGQLCCEEQGPVSRAPVCFTPTADQKTCPQGCAPDCRSDRNQKKAIAPVDTKADPGQGRPPADLDLDLRRGAERRPPPGTDGAGFPRELRPRQRRSHLQLRRRPRRRAGRDPGPGTHGRGAGKANRETRARKPPARSTAAPERFAIVRPLAARYSSLSANAGPASDAIGTRRQIPDAPT